MMAQPFLVAMEHAEWHAGSVLRKHHRNRALGRIEMEHRYRPPQPVLSCRTVGIDMTGTRTYRSRSASDIIEEQHRIIHGAYSATRNVSSAPPRRPGSSRYTQEANLLALKALKIQGVRPNTATSGRLIRSQSATVDKRRVKSAISNRPTTAGVSIYSPRTGASPRELASDLRDSTNNLLECKRQLREQFNSPCDLNQGIYQRGKKESAPAGSESRPSSAQWLTFGGGHKDSSAGVVDAFTAMKTEEEFFTIDSSTGTQVARQLQKGNKIRIGVNGNIRPNEIKLERLVKQQQQEISKIDVMRTGGPIEPVPLCWSDQIIREDTILLEPTTKQTPSSTQTLCETHPVLFSKTKREDQKKSNKAKNQGYEVRARTKPRVGIDGQESKNSITSLSISSQGDEFEEELEKVTYDDILQMTLEEQQHKKTNDVTEDDASSTTKNVGSARDIDIVKVDTGEFEECESSGEEDEEEEGASVRDEGRNLNTAYSGPTGEVVWSTERSVSRPQTAVSVVNHEPNLDALVVGSGPPMQPRPESSSTQFRSSQNRIQSAGRPPPAKANLHRTVAAGVTSINSTSIKTDPEFIQITSQLPVSRDRPHSSASRQGTAVGITTRPSSRTPSIRSGLESLEEQTIHEEEVEHPKPNTPTESERPTPISAQHTPPSSPTQPVDVVYAFNIPTADYIEHDPT